MVINIVVKAFSRKKSGRSQEGFFIRPAAPWAAILALLLVSGCASWEPTYPDSRPAPPPNPWPVPTETTPQPDGSESQPDSSESTPPPGETGSEPSAPESRPPVPPPAPYGRKPATIALAQQANQQASEGELDSAAATLERALRIDRRDARLWQQLATVRIGQGRAKQAEALLKKSNALANGDTGLQSQNWRYIAQARESLGDRQGAGAALEKARDLRAGG